MRVEPRPSLRFAIGFCLAAASMLPLGFAQADPTDDSLRIYAVDIWQDPPQSWGPGRGVYFGKGLVITAAHVVGLGRSNQAERAHRRHGPARDTPSRRAIFERVDLTLLSIDEQKLPIYLQMRRMPLCDNQPWPGEPVIVAIPEGTARSHVMLPALLPANVQKRFSTVISDVATTGNSGSGVFDAGQKCLLGIMSRKITVRPNSYRKRGKRYRQIFCAGIGHPRLHTD